MADTLGGRDVALYSGVSNRSRGWKPRKTGSNAESKRPAVKRWDGRGRTSYDWDSLRRDPELWFRNGNCFVHLYAQGQSRRGPAFKVSFSTLLAAQCHPLIERFIARDVPAASDGQADATEGLGTASTRESWKRAHQTGRADLYIPPPPGASKNEAILYHITIRNLLAWVFRRRIVGVHLSHSLATLYETMCEFRSPGADNIEDLENFLEDEGFLDMVAQPDYAVAVLHVAETMKIRDLYIEAFAHCVGMYNHLYLGTEYEFIGAESRKLIRRARLDMDLRLSAAGPMLSDFLEEDLSDTYLGLTTAARAHLDRFRTYINGFYATRLGYYPPKSVDIRSIIFEPKVYRTVGADFQALYEYLVNKEFTAASISPFSAQGGVCTLQSVESFDERHGYIPLPHPLPLLPETSEQINHTISQNRRSSWFGGKTMNKLLNSRPDRTRPDGKLLAQAAFLKATNKNRPELYRNELVGAYRRFEEDTIVSTLKADRDENISMADGRKVRWILIYAIHQTIRHCYSDPPAEVRDADRAPYHIGISLASLPPWEHPDAAKSRTASPTSKRLTVVSLSSSSVAADTAGTTDTDSDHSSENEAGDGSSSGSRTSAADVMAEQEEFLATSLSPKPEKFKHQPPPPPPPAKFELQPDIDYLGLANRRNTIAIDLSGNAEVEFVPRTRSLSRGLSRNPTFRRSLGIFRHSGSSGASQIVSELHDQNDAEFGETPSSESPHGSPQGSPRHSRHSSHQEIFIHGYGNGTNPVQLSSAFDDEHTDTDKDHRTDAENSSVPTSVKAAARSLSTSSSSNSVKSGMSGTTAITAATAATTVTSSSTVPACPPIKDMPDLARSPFLKDISSRPASLYGGNGLEGLPEFGKCVLAPPRSHSKVASAPAMAPDVPRCRSAQQTTVPVIFETTDVDAMPAAPAPTVPTNRFSRRRFSVYGGGDEFSGMPDAPLLLSQPLSSLSLRKQAAASGRSGSVSPPQPYGSSYLHRTPSHLDMVHEALLAAHDPMDGMDDYPVQDRGSSLELFTSQLRSRADNFDERLAATRRNRHSSYHGYPPSMADEDVESEWEKFAGVGGHTVPA